MERGVPPRSISNLNRVLESSTRLLRLSMRLILV